MIGDPSLQRISRLRTVPGRIRAAAEHGHSIVFVDGEDHTPVPWPQLLTEAEAVASALQARGIGPGDHVAVLGPTTRDLVTTFQAIWLAAATLVVMPIPMRMASIEDFLDATRLRLHAADAKLLVLDPALMAFYTPAPGDPPSCTYADLAGDAASFHPVTVDPASLAILQFTSGSTSHPKGVMLPHESVCANTEAVWIATEYQIHDDVLVSWVPLYHDLGLIGLLLVGMCAGGEFVQAAPQDFLARPARWMEWISTYGGTATAGPNFSYVLATRALGRAEGLDLSSLRIALNGAEPIQPDQMREFTAAGERFGMRPGCVFPPSAWLRCASQEASQFRWTACSPTWWTRSRSRPMEPPRPSRPAPTTPANWCVWVGPSPVSKCASWIVRVAVFSPSGGWESCRSRAPRLWPATTRIRCHRNGLRRQVAAHGRPGLHDRRRAGHLRPHQRPDRDRGPQRVPEDVERAAAETAGIRPGNVIAFGAERRRRRRVGRGRGRGP